ncbi:MAG: CoA transferase [Acidimicrobiia bacterium]|nr:CoA transferase [Acidimicrobiia bacterium]
MADRPLLAGVRVVESSMLGPAEMGGLLADLGADVIKVEPPQGDYGRQMTWPIVKSSNGEGDASLLSLHINRGKRSIAIDLRKPEGVQIYLDLVKDADVVIEAMRPGALAKRGLSYERLRELNPKIVFCSISGYGATGPYKEYPSHGIAYDTWAGQVPVAEDDHGYTYLPEHTSIGIHAGPLYGALTILAAVISARESGTGCYVDVAQADSAAYFDWYRIESWRAYERPDDEVYGNKSDNYERRAPGTAGMKEGVRYQVYATADGEHVLFMASEQAFWRNFCEAVERLDLFERWPGSKFADHARNNVELQGILTDIFKQKTAAEWIEFGGRHNTPIAPVNTPKTIADDPQFQHRLPWIPKEQLEADMLPFPAQLTDADLPVPGRAPNVGEHTDSVLRDAGYDDARIAALRDGEVVF